MNFEKDKNHIKVVKDEIKEIIDMDVRDLIQEFFINKNPFQSITRLFLKHKSKFKFDS